MVDPDPIDQAYRDAEARFGDAAERSARRARVLAAVAEDKVSHARPAARFAARYGWLAAASVIAIGGYLALDFLPTQQQLQPPAAQTAAVKPPPKPQMLATLPPPPPPDLSKPAPPAPVASDRAATVTHARKAAPGPQAVSPPAMLVPAAPPAEAAPPPPPPSAAEAPPAAPETVMVTGTVIRRPPAIAAAPPPATPQTVTVTGTTIRQPPTMAAPPQPPAAAAPALRSDAARTMGELSTNPDFDELRAAAGAGRIAEVQQLLDQHIPVDSADADGETALMKSVRADQPATAALLIRYGASPDKKNKAGFSARDLVAQAGDPALKRAFGLQP